MTVPDFIPDQLKKRLEAGCRWLLHSNYAPAFTLGRLITILKQDRVIAVEKALDERYLSPSES